MNAVTTPSLVELLHRIGDVPAERVVFEPAPGTATVADVQRLCDGDENRRCELVDGVLVEKTMGHRESWIALWLGIKLGDFVLRHQLGVMSGEAGPYEIHDEQIRFPDIAYTSWDRIPADTDPAGFVPAWVPNLAVEVLSPSNTRRELQRKLADYFSAGVQLVWFIDPQARTVEVFTGPGQKLILGVNDMLTGGTVLPGFEIPVKEMFQAGEYKRPDPSN